MPVFRKLPVSNSSILLLWKNMKNKFSGFVFVMLFVLNTGIYAQSKIQLTTEKDKISYSIGLSIGNNFKQQTLDIALEPLMQGIRDALSEAKPLLPKQEIKATMGLFRQQMQRKMKQKKEVLAEKNLKDGERFLLKNKRRKTVETLPSGLQYEILKEGKEDGDKPGPEDTVTTHYRGTLIDGKEFDSSVKRGKPASFPVKGVIKGWTEALQLMQKGAKWKLFIPPHLAYGEGGAGKMIGPNATLIFELELLDIKLSR